MICTKSPLMTLSVRNSPQILYILCLCAQCSKMLKKLQFREAEKYKLEYNFEYRTLLLIISVWLEYFFALFDPCL